MSDDADAVWYRSTLLSLARLLVLLALEGARRGDPEASALVASAAFPQWAAIAGIDLSAVFEQQGRTVRR